MKRHSSYTWSRFSGELTTLFVILSCLTFVLLMSVLPIWRELKVYPNFFLILLYHWGLYRPDLLTVRKVFLFGLIRDGVFFLPLGLSSCIWVGLYGLIGLLRGRSINPNFAISWLGFSLIALADGLLFWVGTSWMRGDWPPVTQGLPSLVLTILLYPIAVTISFSLQGIIDRKG